MSTHPALYVVEAAAKFEAAIDRAIESRTVSDDGRNLLKLARDLLADAPPWPSVVTAAILAVRVGAKDEQDQTPFDETLKALMDFRQAMLIQSAEVRMPQAVGGTH